MTVAREPLWAAVDLGGTALKAALATGNGVILGDRTTPTPGYGGVDATVKTMAELIADLAQEHAPPKAIGVGCPGLVDRESGRTRFLPNLPGQWRDVALADRLSALTGAPVHLLNDARMATLGELCFGVGRDLERPTLVVFTIGTGIGGGLAIDGRLRLGPLGSAGELGHLVIERGGRRCGCGGRGCVEAYASAPAMVGEAVRLVKSGQAPGLHALVEGDLGRISPRTMADAAERGDESIAAAIQDAAYALGLAAASITVAIHPQVIVLTGGVARMGARLIDGVRAGLEERVHVFPPDDVEIVVSELEDRAGLLGGIALAARGGQL